MATALEQLLLRNCATCGTCFEASRPTALYCGVVCRDDAAATRRADRRRTKTGTGTGGLHACADCPATFPTGNALGGHRVRILASLTFTCGDCGRVYDDSNRLAHHVRELHDPPLRAAHEVVVAPRLLAWAIA